MNWLVADADNYDLDGKTEGTHFMKLWMGVELNGRTVNRGQSNVYFGGTGTRLKLNSQNHPVRVEGIATTWTNYGLVAQYISNAALFAHGVEYLCWKRGANDYFPFVDNSQAIKDKAKGSTTGIPAYRATAGEFHVTVSFNFDIIW